MYLCIFPHRFLQPTLSLTGALSQFVSAVMTRWPNAVLQFEDFSTNHALRLLERYRNHYMVFNDDIQGTAASALAGMYGAMRVLVGQGRLTAHSS